MSPGPRRTHEGTPTPEEARQRLQAALDELSTWIRGGGTPARQDARAVLVPLGRLVLTAPNENLGPVRARLETLVAPCREAWEAAVTEELTLACAEHVQGVDPRFLELPNYDLGYTLAARERLEARLAAAGLLRLEAPEHLLEGVREADRLLNERVEAEERRKGS